MSILSIVSNASAAAVLQAVSRSQAIIEFDVNGKILTANENFCNTLGYQLAEIVGHHHRMFVDPAEASTEAYRRFWAALGQGEFDRQQYKRIAKGGREVWIEASYNPVMVGGRVVKVVKFATDITASKLKSAEDAGKLEALSRAQATIEFTPNGDILTANENFLATLGYELREIKGRHHSMFCDPTYAAGESYRGFWRDLAGGKFVADEFMRLGKGGKKVFIQASYNPIFDMDGNVFKVVKFATDVTQRVHAVSELGRGIQLLAEGDLLNTIDQPFLPTFEKLRQDFNSSILRLRQVVQDIAANAGTIRSGAKEISSASNDLAHRTEKQAAAVEETAAALEEITVTVADTSKKAGEAGVLMQEAKLSTEESTGVLQDTVTAMAKIESSSTQIANIIGVIDEIAFQTNLLALNAGVEAARAGEAGKGFAVVAQEVRELAQRSATAAREIKTLIKSSGGNVKEGVALVSKTGEVLNKIAAQIDKVSFNVSAIVLASREQSTSLLQINQAFSEMDRNTQQNAAMVEQSNAASAQLTSEAASLFDLIGHFKTGATFPKQTSAAAPLRAAKSVAAQHRALQQSFSDSTALKTNEWQEF